ncbi:DASS family sodium-coupled anion symporter [Devriesea agamarum]|uniref:DASS family sodium-coupled anion symporter n=1 Tax=Devriesea agamarum TaxID=472569 RepID=UPI0009FF1F4F|nr:DASS family sodium-coupled anion symporter [Devriesea agamarum]
MSKKSTFAVNWVMVIKVVVILAVTIAIFFIPPQGVNPRGMHMLAIFIGTILGLILQPLPTASVSLIGLAAAMVTGTMHVKGEALSGFSNSSVWLIVAAFFIAEGFLVTGLGRRIALLFIRVLGRSTLGLAYGMALTDLVLAPATPSNTARAGGVVYPIIASLSREQGSTPESDESRRRVGSYLSMTAVQVNAVTAAMFVTAMAGNPIAKAAAAKAGIDISWGTWTLAALVPGLVLIGLVPLVMRWIYKPTLLKTPDAPRVAREELVKLGRMSGGEWVMAGTFVLLLVLWIFSAQLHIAATASAFLGIGILLITRVLSWRNLAANASAWSTLIFFAVLVGMANQLNKLGVIGWLGRTVAASIHGLPWMLAFAILCIVYFYAHYLFASNTAQIVAMYAVFLSAAVAVGTPALFAALIFGFIGNLFGGLTHYASGPAGVIYGSGFVKTTEWFRVGFLMSIVFIAVWAVVGGLWMKLLGMW